MNTAHTRKFFAIVTTAVILIGMGSAFNPLPPVPLTGAAARQDASTRPKSPDSSPILTTFPSITPPPSHPK